MNLSTENYTHALVFFDKSHLLITEKEYNWFMEQSSVAGQSGVQFRGRYIAFGSVAQAMELADFYEQYPQLRPAPPTRNFSEELRQLEEQKRLERENYPKGGYAMNLKRKDKPASWWMDSCIASFKKQIEDAKKKGEPYEGKLRLLGQMEASRSRKYG